MDSRDGKDSTRWQGGRRTPRRGRGPLAVALPALLVLCCLFAAAAAPGAAATAGAIPGAAPASAAIPGAAPGFTAPALLAGLALQQAQLTAADGAATDWFGHSVAVFGDTALVGAPRHEVAGLASAGAAYVFVRSGGSWIAQAELTATDGAAGDYFGFSVALSGDTALVGAPYHPTSGAVDSGAAYVFTRSGGMWTQQATPIAADGAADDAFGFSVALSGGTALVGAPYHDTAGKGASGAAYVFTRSGGAWTQEAKPIAEDGIAGDWFGQAVALAGDTALVGAPSHDTTVAADAGAAYVFLIASAPTVTKLGPASAKRGATVTISGTGFGAAGVTGFVKFGAKKCATYLSWSNTRIKCKVPAKAKYGSVQVTVTTAGGTSNAWSFKVKR